MNTKVVVNRDLPDVVALKLLDAVALEPTVSQRALSDRLGIALGLVNAYIKRLCKKGHLKVTTLPRNRIKYLITPQGMAEKVRLTYSYIDLSINNFRDMRGRIELAYGKLLAKNCRRILLWGDGEVAELCYISTRGIGLDIVGAVSDKANGHDFFGRPVVTPYGFDHLNFDAVLIASTDEAFIRLATERIADSSRIHHLDDGELP